MPNKSDSAGKLHQYFTALALKENFPNAQLQSPLTNCNERNIHLSLFDHNTTTSLKCIGSLTAEVIIKHINKENIAIIDDIGVNSGASGHTNTDDLLIITDSGKSVSYSLKCATNITQILSKNMGASSLISSYFGSHEQQTEFNYDFEKSRLYFLNKFFDSDYKDISLLRKDIETSARNNGYKKARFTDYPHMDDHRKTFLRELRDNLLNKLNKIKNSKKAMAVNLILDTNKNHLIAIYGKKKSVEYVCIKNKNQNEILNIYTRGNDSVVINTGDYEVGFRYKFESGITSSIKLVGDYKKIND